MARRTDVLPPAAMGNVRPKGVRLLRRNPMLDGCEGSASSPSGAVSDVPTGGEMNSKSMAGWIGFAGT